MKKEQWKDIQKYEGLYQISNSGQVHPHTISDISNNKTWRHIEWPI